MRSAPGGPRFRSKLIPALIDAYCRATGDPEGSLGQWLLEGAPLGLTQAIPMSGIFPPVDTSGGSKEEFESLTAKIREAQFRNYTSFEEEPDLARGEIQRCIEAEHMTEFRTLEEVQEYVGGKPLL